MQLQYKISLYAHIVKIVMYNLPGTQYKLKIVGSHSYCSVPQKNRLQFVPEMHARSNKSWYLLSLR